MDKGRTLVPAHGGYGTGGTGGTEPRLQSHLKVLKKRRKRRGSGKLRQLQGNGRRSSSNSQTSRKRR